MDSNNPDNKTIAGAITFPTRNQNVTPVPEQPRQPRNLQGLLRFAMEATKAEDAPGSSDLGPMDEERRKFLEEALKSLTVDVVEVLQSAIKKLNNEDEITKVCRGDPLPPEIENAFGDILAHVDDIDMANDFYKLGGFCIFPVCFGSENELIISNACSVLGELCQNNPFCQSKVMECGLLDILISLMGTHSEEVLKKCVFAVSCICREYEPACKEFIAQGGCETLIRILNVPDPNTKTKAAFFIRYLSTHYPEAKEKFLESNIIAVITDQIKQGRDASSEHLASILLTMLEDLDVAAMPHCGVSTVELRSVLENHLKHPDLEDDTFREEKQYCQELLNRLPKNEEVVDR